MRVRLRRFLKDESAHSLHRHSKALQQIEGEKLLPKACLHLTHLQQYFFESQKNYELQFRFTKD